MENKGFIKLHRKLLDSPVWKCSNSVQKEILITLLLMTNFKPNRWFHDGQEFDLEAGQLLTSLASIKENCSSDVSIQNIRTALNRFEKMEFLTAKSTNKFRIITILNWETYQNEKTITNRQTNRQLTGNQQATNRQLTAIKECNNVRREECKKKEEIIWNTDNLAQSDFLQNPSTPESAGIEPEIDYRFYVDSTRGPVGITEEHLDQLAKLCPAVDPNIEFINIKLWTDANPKRRKTPQGVKNFVNNWFKKTQNQGGNNGINANKQTANRVNHGRGAGFTMSECYANLEKLSIEIPDDGDSDLIAQWGARAKF